MYIFGINIFYLPEFLFFPDQTLFWSSTSFLSFFHLFIQNQNAYYATTMCIDTILSIMWAVLKNAFNPVIMVIRKNITEH